MIRDRCVGQRQEPVMSSAQTEERERKTESIKQQKNMLPNTEPARETRGP